MPSRRENRVPSPRDSRIPTSNLRSSIATCRSHFSEIFHGELIDRPMNSRHCLFAVFAHDLRPSQRPRNNRWGSLSLSLFIGRMAKNGHESFGTEESIQNKIVLLQNYSLINNFDIMSRVFIFRKRM